MAMTKETLQQLAEAGVRQRVADVERELAEYFKVWPDVFISATAPQLLKAMPKAKSGSTNGHWPVTTFTKTKDPSAAMKKAWTPKRRAEQAKRMARLQKHGHISKSKNRSARINRVRAYLKKHGESSTADLMVASGYNNSAGLISAMKIGLKSGIFQRTGRGRYALGSKA